jgi:DNA-binding transcriptional MerR regulator
MDQPIAYTTGAIARRLGIAEWKVRRIFERGLLPDPGRAGTYRLIPASDLPKVEDALRRAGYLQASAMPSSG